MGKRFTFCIALAALLGLTLAGGTAFAQWEADVRLTANDDYTSQTAEHPNQWQIAPSGDTLHVVWYDDRDGNSEIYTKRSTNRGTSWGGDVRLTSAPDTSRGPSVAVAGSNVHVVWWDTRSGAREIFYKRSTDGGSTWGSDILLVPNYGGYPELPCVAVSGSTVHVAWDNMGVVRYMRSTDRGVTWGTPFVLDNSQWSCAPSLGVVGSTVHAAWYSPGSGMDFEIYYRRSTDGGASWGAAVQLTSTNPGDCLWATLAASGSYVHVAYYLYDGFTMMNGYKRSTDGGATWRPQIKLDVPGLLAGDGRSLVASGSNVHLVSDLNDGSATGFEIYYWRSTNGGATWEPNVRLTNDPAYSVYPSIAVSGTAVHVAWSDTRDDNDTIPEIYSKRNLTGNPSGIEEIGRGPALSVAKSFTATPNPFTSFATVLGHEREQFALYDVSGRKMGTYNGSRIGEGLSPGVYFLKAERKDAKPLRIVKIR